MSTSADDTKDKAKLPYSPRRIYVPREQRNSKGEWVFLTSDKEKYVRGLDGSIRRATPKVNGKMARKIRRQMRGKTCR